MPPGGNPGAMVRRGQGRPHQRKTAHFVTPSTPK
jgi:hypothetical protein